MKFQMRKNLIPFRCYKPKVADMKISLIGLFLLVLFGCSLNAKQEQKLNESLALYLYARNECQVVSYVAFTLPDLVAKYKDQGDSIFKSKFDCNVDSLFYQDPTIRETVKDDATIHVLYDLVVFNKISSQRIEKKHQLVAMSNDNGASWFFIDQSIYVDKSLLPELKRLLSQ